MRPTCFQVVDGGVVEDGGVVSGAAGGTILDGDYDFVGWVLSQPDPSLCTSQTAPAAPSQRTIRVFGGGTYIEWAAIDMNPSADGGLVDFWYDSTAKASGHTLSFTYPCGGLTDVSYGYTASGNELVFFVFNGGADGDGGLASIDTYQRTCAR